MNALSLAPLPIAIIDLRERWLGGVTVHEGAVPDADPCLPDLTNSLTSPRAARDIQEHIAVEKGL